MTVKLQPRLSGYGRVKPLNRRDRQQPPTALAQLTPKPRNYSIRVLCQHAVDRCATDTERGRNRAGRFTIDMHPAGKLGLRLVERLWSTDRLAACPARFACCCPALPTAFQL